MTKDYGEGYLVTGPNGFTTFEKDTVDALIEIGLIEYDRSEHVLRDGNGRGVGPIFNFYREATR